MHCIVYLAAAPQRMDSISVPVIVDLPTLLLHVDIPTILRSQAHIAQQYHGICQILSLFIMLIFIYPVISYGHPWFMSHPYAWFRSSRVSLQPSFGRLFLPRSCFDHHFLNVGAHLRVPGDTREKCYRNAARRQAGGDMTFRKLHRCTGGIPTRSTHEQSKARCDWNFGGKFLLLEIVELEISRLWDCSFLQVTFHQA